jgi:hypothetical protein
MTKRIKVTRKSYQDDDGFFRDIHTGGGPRLEELDELGRGTGYYADLHRAIWGASEADFTAAVKHEQAQEQRQRPHVFVAKRKARR